MTRDEFLARRRAAAEQQDEETTAQRPAVSSAASTGMTREEFLERRRAGMEAAEQQTSTSVSRPTSVSPDTDSTLRRLAAAKEQNRKTTRAELEETRTGSGRQLPGASGKLGDMLLDATRYQQAHKTGPSGEDALAYGIMSGTGAASLAALAGRALTGERADWYNDYQREAAEAAQAHPTAYGVGNVGGSLGIAYATGGLAGAATGALLTGEGAATAAGTVIKGLARNAMTFAMTDAIHNAGTFAADSMSDRDFINSMGVGMAQGAAGGLAAGLVSSGMANVLRKHNMMTPFMEFVRQTAAGTASAGANIATSYALRENKPTKEQMAQQFATAFLLSALQGAISTYETVQANKDQLEQYTAQMVKTWQQMAAQGQAAGMDRTQAGQQAFADQIRDLSTQIRFTLGRTYMAGQQQYVDNLYSLLDTLDDMIDTSMAQNAEWVYDTPVSPYNDAMLGSGEDIVPQLTEAITTGMTEGANQPPTPPVTPEAPVDTTIAAAGAQTPAPPEVSPETEEALRALTEQPDVPAAPETPQEPEIETPEEVIPPEPETPAAPEPEPEPESAAEPETVSPAETLRQNAEAGGLGKKGQQAIGDFYSGGMDPEQLTQYYAGFSAYYKAGGDGVPAERVRSPFADALSEQAKIGAWSSGRADALAEGRTIPEPETAVAQTEPSGYNEITEQPKPEAVQPEPMTTAETAKPTVEQAKADLKRAIQVPVQTGNLDALRAAIESGELSTDVVTLGSKVPGFTREQQESLARQIIEGQQDGKEVIHADVPGDGRFDINTSDQDAVPKVLNALHVKVNQEAVITKDIDSWLKRSGKSGRSYVGRAGEEYFLSDGYAAVRVPKAAADYALKEPAYKAQLEDFRAQLNAAKVASGTLEEPRRGKMTVRGQATQVYAFRTADGVLAFPKDAFNKIDGGTLSYGPMGRGFIAVSRGEDGEVRAFALAIDPKTFRQEDYNGIAPVKIKATLATADTSTDNSLPAAGAQGATREKEADNGIYGRSPEGDQGIGKADESISRRNEDVAARGTGGVSQKPGSSGRIPISLGEKEETGREIAEAYRRAAVEPTAGTKQAQYAERVKEYGLEVYMVPAERWRQTGPTASYGGAIYFSSAIDEDTMKIGVEHEISHVMKQLSFTPYKEFLETIPGAIRFTPEAEALKEKARLKDLARIAEAVWKHIGLDGEADWDQIAENTRIGERFYDELNATLYSYIANGITAGELDDGEQLDFHNVLRDIDQYKADMDAIVAQFKEERTGGQGNGGVQGRTEEVGKGRRVSGGGGPGRPGSGAAETVPEAGRGLQDSGDRGPERVPENERLAGPAPGSGLHAGERLLPGGDDRGAETEAGRAVPEQGAGEGRSGVGSAPSPDRGGRSGGPAVKQKRRTALNKNNYRITEDIDSSRPNFSDNYKAIQLIKTLEKENRPATAEERGVLARYKGWGGLKDAVLNANSYQATQLKRLLTPEEFSTARDSVLNAHYTSTKVISAIYDGVQRLGFDGGRVLEPSMGVGNFFGVMPEKLTKRSELYGVELDSITGKIAQNLYPDAKIDVAGFQDVLYPDNTFDLVIGNVPFSSQIHIPYRGSTYNLHDFFFVKALDETRPGGMVALITSTGTLDKISGKTQSEIAKRANLIAAFRLPDDAFRVNAGTSVTTDLIFLQKKGPGDESNGIEFGKIGKIDGIPINEYYVEHPKNVLGELAFEKGMYAGERTVVHATPGVNFQERLAAAMRTLPRNVMKEGAENKAPVRAKKRGERKRTTFVMTEDGAQITDKDTGEVIRYEEGTKAQKEKVDTIRDYIKVKTAFDGLVNAERSGNLEAAEDFRKKLNREYDDFAEKHGPILFNKRLLAADDDFVRMTGLELQSKEGVSKSAIFTRPTISKAKRTSAGSSDEALSIVLNEEGRVNVPRMAALTGRTEQQVLEDLEGEIIFTPDGDYVLTAQYASGNIYEKLAAIEGREGFEEQRKVLEAALPKKKGVGEIRASLGAHWIAPKYVREFLQETFNPQYGSIDVQYSRELGKWQVNHFWTTSKKYSTDSMEAWKVAEGTLNGKNLTVYDKDADGRRITNRDETAAVQQKQADLRNAFEEWVFRDKERADDLIDTYNRTFNAVAPMDYADLGQRIDFGLGPDAKKQPRDYQKTAVARIVFGGNTLLHHGVGTGKTLDMILAAHVMKQNGTAQKPLFVVPNGKVNDFRNEILEVYPDASILALDNETMSPKQLQRTKAQIATGDWDYVLVYRSAFERLAVSPETEARFLQQQLDMFEEAIRDSAGERNGTNRFEKSLIGRKKTLEERIKKTLAKPKDETTYFEDMGIDALFVDEAHNFKKVGFPTSFEISGIDSSSNQITTDLYMKENYLRDRGGKIVLATATPITNTLSEMYNMALHVAPEVYESAGIYTFDTWLNTFGQIESQPEIAPDGKTWRMKERVRGFRNGNEMVGLYRQFADVVQTKDVVKGLPEAEFIDVVSPATELNQKLLDSFADRATRAGRRGDKGDNMLQITNDGRAAGTDLRLLTGVIGEMFPDMKKSELDVPTSKLNKCVQLVAQEYKDSADIKGTQFIFLDLGVNDGGKRYSFNLYKDLIAKLEKAGIPRSEIANIQDYDGEDKRSELYDKMNSGELRVLIGSTAKMGEGVNAQERAVALHHLNVPYRPDNLEQREGRIIRFGNINKKVRIYRYIQEKSFDSYMWQMIERKAAYTAQALAGGDAADLEEVGDIELKAREAKGIATGNPLIVEKMKLQDQAEKLRAIYRNWQGERYSAARNAERYREEIPRLERAIEKIKQDIRTVEKNRGDEFRITIGGKTYDSRKDAIKPLNAMLKHANIGKTIGSINGLDIVLHEPYLRDDGDYAFTLRGAYEYSGSFGNSEDGNLTRVTNKGTKGPEDELKRAEADLAYDRRALKDAEEMQKGAFPQQEELDRVTARQLEVDRELGITENEEAVELGQDDGDAVHASIDPTGGMMHPERWTAERVGDREKQAKSLSEIMEQIRHDFGINITKGHIRGRGVMGQYDDSNRGMRIRSANDLPTSVHELGHHLDNVYKFSESLTAAEKKELLDQLPEELKARYKDKEQPGEGVAEFVRRFMTNRTTAALDYPEFTKKFLNTMNGHDRALVEQLADEVNAALALDVDTATSSIRLREDGRPDARTIREKVNDMFHVAYQAFTDSLHGIKLFDEATGSSVYKLASNAAYVDNIAGQIVIGDLTDLNGQYVGPGLKTVLTGLDLKDNDTYMKFGEYLVVKHGPERLAEGMRIFADDRKNSEAFMNRRQQELEQEHPEFIEISDRLYEFQRQLLETWGVATGLLSQDQVDSWLKRWAYYVPFNRAVPVESRGLRGKRGFANQTSPFKKAVGSGLDIIHPVDSIVGHVAVLVNNGMKNNVARSLADAARNTPANAQLIEKIPTPMIPHKIGLKGVKQGIEDTAEMLLEKELIGDQAFLGIEAILHSMQDFMMQYTRQQPHGNIITVMRDGRPEYWKVNDPLLLRSLADMSPAKQEGFLAAYGMISRFMTTNITGMNVVWSIFSNAPRDLGTFFGYSKERNPLKVFPAIASAYANKANMSRGKDVDPLYKEYLAMGGGAMSMYSADSKLAQKARKQLAQTSISANPLEWISWMGDLIEQGPRYATYKLMRLRGMSPAEAFYEATDITVNFRRGGRLSRKLNKLFPFFNAGVQGMDKFVRYFGAFDVPPGGPPKGPGLTGGDAGDGGNGPGGSGSGGSVPRDERSRVRRSRMMWYLIASAIAAAVSFAINHMTKDREEDYKRLSNWTKNNYFLVPIGDGRYFAISKPREVGVLSSFMESAAERVLMDDKHAMDGFYEYVTDVMLPGGVAEIAQGDWASAVGSMGLFGVGAYQMANRDFLGRPIVSSGLTKLESKDQYNDRTSKLAYYMGQAFNISPQRADFFFEQVLGGWWKYQKAVFPVASENRDLTLGVYNQYIKDSQYSTDLLNRMYDRTKASETAKNSDPDDMDKAIWYKMDNNLSTFYGRFYKLSKEDSRSEQARAARKAVLEMINEYEITRESGLDPAPFESVWGEVFDAVRETGKTELLPKVLNPLIKSEKGYSTDLNAQQYLEYQTKYNDLYADIVADALQNARNDSEKYALIAKANEVAQERAQDYMLKRLGVPETSAIEAKYGDVSDADIATFQALLYLAGQDGGVTNAEAAQAIDRMRREGLNREDAGQLYYSQTKSESDEKLLSTGVSVGLTESDIGLFHLAVRDADKPSKSGKYGTYTAEEYENAIRATPGLTREQRDFLYMKYAATKAKPNPPRW